MRQLSLLQVAWLLYEFSNDMDIRMQCDTHSTGK